MEQEKLIEECFYIKPAEMIKTLKLVNDGDFSARNRPDINFWLNDPSDIFNISISVNGGDPQIINLEMVFITYGERAYFKCSCGATVTKLYLPKGSKELKCRKCHKLQYFLTTFSKNSVGGKEIYKMNRMQKLLITREGLNRILYRGNYTKRFSRFLDLCNKAGLNEVVKNAQGLMELIKG